jgi:tRNA 2-(methylsulfanyl)-N6-isopentenyladenosine37 hydroxylase
MFCLKSDTKKEWVEAVAADPKNLLKDHAHCENKAAASAMSLLAKFPNDKFLVKSMVALAHEELEHFEEIYDILEAKGWELGHMDKDPYVQQLIPLGRKNGKEHIIDRLLISALIEARSAERFSLLAEALEDPELKGLYKRLFTVEARHHSTFIELACHYDDREVIKHRLTELAIAEAKIVDEMPVMARMHG